MARLSRGVAAAVAGALLNLGLFATDASSAPAERSEVAVVRGAEVAQARCASCHAVGLEDRSPNPHAPLFRVLARLYSRQTLTSEILDFADVGHFEMPVVALREEEVADVAAYIASLEGRRERTGHRRPQGSSVP